MKSPSSQTLAKCLVTLLGVILISGLLYQSAWVREIVVGMVAKLGSPAVPYLRHVLREDEDNKVRQTAHTALVEIGEDAVPSLAESLQDANPQVRRQAARALIVVGRKAQSAVPILIETLKSDKDKEIRRDVMTVLGSLGGKAQDAIPALLSALKDPDAGVRATAAEALSMIGVERDTEPIVAVLIDSLNDEAAAVRQEAAEGLGRIGPRAKSGISALTRAMEDSNTAVKKEAHEALWRITGEKK
jgi:HEAT repeat protein